MVKSNLQVEYQFQKLKQMDELLYTVDQKYNKDEYSEYIYSYSSKAVDLNKTKFELLEKHKNIIDYSIKYIAKQIEDGMSMKHCIWPLQLSRGYHYRVFQAAKKLVKLKKHGTLQGTYESSSQKYWIDRNNLVTYGLRKDKDLKSKYQAFVEFKNANAYAPNIKLNLQLPNKCYQNFEKFYYDGIDLVFNFDKSVSVRHIVKQLVKIKEHTGIDKLLFIDKWLHIYDITVDTNTTDKSVTGIINKCQRTSSMKKALASIQSDKLSPASYIDKLHRVRMAIRAKLERTIGSTDEDNVTVLLPSYQHKFANHITEIFRQEAKSICDKKGLKCKFIEKSDIELDKIVKCYKQQTSKSNCKFFHQWKTEHTKWSEYTLAFMKLKYKHSMIFIKKSRKSSVETLLSTSQKDEKAYNWQEELQQLEKEEVALIDQALANFGKTGTASLKLMRLAELRNLRDKENAKLAQETSKVEEDDICFV